MSISMPRDASRISHLFAPLSGDEARRTPHIVAPKLSPVAIPYRPRTDVSPGIRRRVYERDDWTCQYCNRRIAPTTDKQSRGRNAPVDMSSGSPVWLELDHITPRKLGGSNTVNNLRAACSPCNRRKSDSTQAVDWALRAALAIEILMARPADRSSVLSAARALLGVTAYIDDEGRVSLRSDDGLRSDAKEVR